MSHNDLTGRRAVIAVADLNRAHNTLQNRHRALTTAFENTRRMMQQKSKDEKKALERAKQAEARSHSLETQLRNVAYRYRLLAKQLNNVSNRSRSLEMKLRNAEYRSQLFEKELALLDVWKDVSLMQADVIMGTGESDKLLLTFMEGLKQKVDILKDKNAELQTKNQEYESLIKTNHIQHNKQQETIKSQRVTIKSQQATIKSQQDRLKKLEVMSKRYRITIKNVSHKDEQAKAQTGNNGNRKLKKRRLSQIS